MKDTIQLNLTVEPLAVLDLADVTPVVEALTKASIWFAVDPWPDDVWAILVKPDGFASASKVMDQLALDLGTTDLPLDVVREYVASI